MSDFNFLKHYLPIRQYIQSYNSFNASYHVKVTMLTTPDKPVSSASIFWAKSCLFLYKQITIRETVYVSGELGLYKIWSWRRLTITHGHAAWEYNYLYEGTVYLFGIKCPTRMNIYRFTLYLHFLIGLLHFDLLDL